MLNLYFNLAGLYCGISCHFPSCATKSLESSISSFLLGDCMFLCLFFVLSLWGNVLVSSIIYSYFHNSCISFVYNYNSFAVPSSNQSFLQKPRAWNMQALQIWFQTVVVTKDFIYSIYCLSFLTSHLCLKC